MISVFLRDKSCYNRKLSLSLHSKKTNSYNMATPIKAVPILTGDLAEDFINRAEENERKPRHILSPEREKKIADIMSRSRNFVPSWMRNG